MEKYQVILASKSENRSEVLKKLGLNHKRIASQIDESLLKGKYEPSQLVLELSSRKCEKVTESVNKNAIIIACDTIIVSSSENKDKLILGKPKNEQEAKKFLKSLSNKTHLVITGCTIIKTPENTLYQTVTNTKVTFRNLYDDEIGKYLLTEEWMGKAGAYGIQGFGGTFIEKIEGDYFSIIGLPLSFIWETIIRELGVEYLYR